MGLQTWGGLPKSSTDDETIEEAIGRLITTHEGDSSAHLGVGESLQSHKNDPVIDHPAKSIVPDKFSNDKAFLNLNVFPFISGSNDNCSGGNAPPFIYISQSSPLTGDGTYFIAGFIPEDFGYDDGDIILDSMLYASGYAGAWTAEINFSFAKIQLKSGSYRVGYYSAGWNYSNWISHSVGVPLRFRIFYDSANSEISFFLRDDLVFNDSYIIDFDGGEFSAIGIINRNGVTSASLYMGAVSVWFSGF